MPLEGGGRGVLAVNRIEWVVRARRGIANPAIVVHREHQRVGGAGLQTVAETSREAHCQLRLIAMAGRNEGQHLAVGWVRAAR